MKTVSLSMAEDFRALGEDILSLARGRQQFMADMKSRVADLAAGTKRYLHDCDTRQRALKNEVQHAACELRQKLGIRHRQIIFLKPVSIRTPPPRQSHLRT